MADDVLQVNDTPVPSITVHNKDPITNELLCYVECKIYTCTFDVIVKMCADFCDGDVITVAKDDLMACVTLPEDDKRSGRRRANLKEVHMNDIVSILLEMKPETVPVFLARDLNNNFDMSRIILEKRLLLMRYLSPPYISSVFKMASTWRYTLVCLDSVMDISTTD